MPAACKSCGALIDWAEGVLTRAMMPVDHDSKGLAGGNLAVWRTDDGRLWCRALKKGEEPTGNEKLGTPHWATCLNASGHRTRSSG